MPLDEEELAEAKAAWQRWTEHNPQWTDPLLNFLAGWQIALDVPAREYPGVTLDPNSRLTMLADVASKAIRAHPQGGKSVKMIVMLQEGPEGGIEVSGYRDSAEAIADVLAHVVNLIQSHGLNAQSLLNHAQKYLAEPPPIRTSGLRTQDVPAGFRKD